MTARNPIGRSERLRLLPIVAIAISTLGPGVDADAQASDAMRACAAEKDDARRLACYDRAVAQGPAVDAATAPIALPTAPAAPPKPEDKFGYRGSIARKDIDEKAASEAGADRIEAEVVELAVRPLGQWVVTLDNGQVWAQKMVDATRLKVGDRVVIKKASFGSFLLVAPNNRTTRVTRER